VVEKENSMDSQIPLLLPEDLAEEEEDLLMALIVVEQATPLLQLENIFRDKEVVMEKLHPHMVVVVVVALPLSDFLEMEMEVVDLVVGD
jgi:hypothetical protein